MEMMEALAAERPLILVLEDLHWSDYSTLDLVAAVARRRDPARLLLIGTYRSVDVIARGHPLRAVTQELARQGASEELRLEPLGQPDVRRYLATRFGGEIGTWLAGCVHHRTDGLPLFMVTVADTLVRQGLLVQAAGRWEVKAVDAEVETAVPDSLRQMIEHQVAGLAPDEQRLLEAASVAGMAFSAASVAAALEADVEAVEDRCEALVRREQFLRSSGVEEWPDGTLATGYRFLHVFSQQVLSERLPAARRASLHRRIGEREEVAYRSRPGDRAAALAVHFERGRDAGRAIAYRRLAAEHAIQRCAHREAVEHLTHGRQLLDTLEDGRERRRLELELQTTLGPSLIALHSATSPQVETVYRRARELAEDLDDGERLHRALWGLWYVHYSRGRYAVARETGEQLLTLAERAGDRTQLLQAHHALGPTLLAMGDAMAARACLEQGLTLYDPSVHRTPASLYVAHDAGACGHVHLALTQWVLGSPDRSLVTLQDAIRLAERLLHPTTTIAVLNVATWVYHLRGAHEAARQSAEALNALAAEHGATAFVDESSASLACLPILDGPRDRRLAEQYELLARIREWRTPWRHVLSVCLLADVSTDPPAVAMGLEALAAIPEEHRRVFFTAEIERVRGMLLLRLGKPDDAEGCLRHAIETARGRAERSLELRAATSLARLLAGRGRRDEARRVLEPSYGWFTEGFDTTDLREARTLLDRLRLSPEARSSRHTE